MNLSPLRDYVLCETLPDLPRSTHLTLIEAPQTAQRAKITAVGPECQFVKPGETILVSRLIGQTVGDQVLVQEPYILAWL